MKKLAIILVILIGLYFAAGYFLGNLPIASDLLGSNKARDLGVDLTVEAADNGLKALNHPLTMADLEAIARDPSVFTRVKATITDEEASSLLAIGDIPNFPLRNIEMKFGDGGAVRASGILDIVKLQAALDDVGVSGDAIDKVLSIAKSAKYMPFYMEGSLDIANNQVNMNVKKLELGRISLPSDWVDENLDSISEGIARTLTSNGYNIRSLAISDGKMDMDMDRPLSSIQPWLKMVEQ